jgi:hypothetical protein
MTTQRYSADPNALFQPAPTPTRMAFRINSGQSWLHAVADATGQHRVGRTQTGDDLFFTEEGGSHLSVVPAGSLDELAAQVNRLREAFEVHEGRPPSELDDAFWEAVNVLHDAYTGPALGSSDAVRAGLS